MANASVGLEARLCQLEVPKLMGVLMVFFGYSFFDFAGDQWAFARALFSEIMNVKNQNLS